MCRPTEVACPLTERAVPQPWRVRRVGRALLVSQLVAMLIFSGYQYSHYAETYDFGVYNQAWTLIAHGHMDPWSTLLQAPFWRNNAEFVMWPLSALYWLNPHPIDLLVVQDLAVVLTELVVFGWAMDLLERSAIEQKVARLAGLGTALVLVLDPWAWNTIAFDFHAHTIATLFVVLAGRDLWSGRTRRCWVWAIAAILTDAPGALYVVGVGAAAAVSTRQVRRTGIAVTAVAAVWFVMMTQLGGDGVGGSGLGLWYGYLVGSAGGHVGLGSILVGALRHPGLLAHMFSLRWRILLEFLVVFGVVGVLSPWGLFPSAVVFLPTLFNASDGYLRIEQSFQSWPALPFVLIGTLSILVGLWRSRRWLAGAVAGWWWCAFCVVTAVALPAVPRYWLSVSDSGAGQLAHLSRMIPQSAEVVADNGVLGRFSGRSSVYELVGSSIPVNKPIIVFVVTPAEGVGEPSPQVSYRDIAEVESMGARSLVVGKGVYGLELRVQRGVHRVRLP